MEKFRLAVRQFLFEELSKKYDCKKSQTGEKINAVNLGSDFQDLSYVDFSEAIRIDHEDLRLRAGPVHICVYTDSTHVWPSGDDAIAVYVFSPPLKGSGGQSRCFNNCIVDLPAPDFGNLLEIVDKFIQGAIQSAGQSSAVSFDPAGRMLRPYIND